MFRSIANIYYFFFCLGGAEPKPNGAKLLNILLISLAILRIAAIQRNHNHNHNKGNNITFVK